ncbi:MAG TPA: hypothetical protein VHZ95_22865, partial [Polyangiales bacterium]|nr:hypothetical protein [Polyangiales bacterium]
KELYAKSEKWNALVEVLKSQIDATPDAPVEPKVALLRELARLGPSRRLAPQRVRHRWRIGEAARLRRRRVVR